MLRRVLTVAAVIITALLLQSTIFAQIKLLGVRPELLYLVTIVVAILEGPQRGRDRGVRRRHGAGLPAEPAEGHHGAHAHAPRVRDRDGAPVHRVALAAPADLPRGGRARPPASPSTRSCRSCSGQLDAAAQLLGEGDPADRALQRGPDPDRLSAPPADRSRARAPRGWCASRWRRLSSRLKVARAARGRSCSRPSRRGCGSSRCSPSRRTSRAALDNSVQIAETDALAGHDQGRERGTRSSRIG